MLQNTKNSVYLSNHYTRKRETKVFQFLLIHKIKLWLFSPAEDAVQVEKTEPLLSYWWVAGPGSVLVPESNRQTQQIREDPTNVYRSNICN